VGQPFPRGNPCNIRRVGRTGSQRLEHARVIAEVNGAHARSGWSFGGEVSGLFIKPARHQPMAAATEADARRRHGLVGDCHAQPLGPRQVLIVREESLAMLGVAPWEVRANIATRGLREDALGSGVLLRIGRTVEIRITHECEICKVLRRYVPDSLFKDLAGRRGSLGVIVRGGSLALGDRITPSAAAVYPEVPDRIYQRLAWVVERIPTGRVVTYDRLLVLVGAQRAFFRVLPAYLKRAAAAGLPAHRVLTSAGALTGHMAAQGDLLRAEGVPVSDAGEVPVGAASWDAQLLYLER